MSVIESNLVLVLCVIFGIAVGIAMWNLSEDDDE